jgi:hypothetical protein
MEIDYSKISNVYVEGIDHRDAPDYCDAFIASADYDGHQMDDDMLEELNQDGQFVYDAVINQLY